MARILGDQWTDDLVLDLPIKDIYIRVRTQLFFRFDK